MVVDPRRDHSIRVPRPDLSVRHGTPNACNQCHKEKDASWAAGHVDGWLREAGKQPPGEHWTGAIDAGRRGTPGATGLLAAAATRVEWPGIVRGTAAAMLASSNGQQALSALQQASRDTDPFGRLGAVRGMEGCDPLDLAALLVLGGPSQFDGGDSSRCVGVQEGVHADDRQGAIMLAVLVEH